MKSHINKKNGFTLIEILVAIIIIGIAIASLIGSNGYYSYASASAADITTAEFLVSQIKTITSLLPLRDPQTGTGVFGPEEASLATYDDVDDFDDAVLSPPVDARRSPLSALARFTQQVTVNNISAANFQQTVTDHSSDFIKITVRILADGIEISSVSWIRTLQ
ncbi:MAG: prepilin-type N-terminal cleavage/methylation domain-containing protein [Anaerohalosphaeraceae bacterium]|nr:prepilin-type N-terminal cleavage/methylation domain-containing protein [Anaerohalosphaeraceae bacterium]